MTAPVLAPWVRTRLRTAPLASLLAAVLAFCSVFLAAALPRTLDRSADHALHAFLQRADQIDTQLQLQAGPRYGASSARVSDLDAGFTALRKQVGPDLPVVTRSAAYGEATAHPRDLTDPTLPQPDGIPPKLSLLYLAQDAAHVRLVGGHWPSGAPTGSVVQVALSQAAARTLGVQVGQVLHTSSPTSVAMNAQVVGIYAVADPKDRFWAGLGCAAAACLLTLPSKMDPPKYWLATALIDPASLPVTDVWAGAQGEDFWWLPVDVAALRSDRLADSRDELSSWLSGPTQLAAAAASGRQDLAVESDLQELFGEALTRQSAVAPLTAVGPAGLGGVVVVVLCLAAGLTAERRAAELHLLRARGGSRRGLLLRLLGESATTMLPACVAATALALVLLPTPRLLPSLAAATGAALLALLAVPVLTLARDSLSRRTARQSGGRRVVAELALLAAAVAAVVEVRQRGVGGLDPLQVAAPLLLAAVGAVLLARSQPLLVGLLARTAARGTGVVGFLGLARAARGAGDSRRPSLLPLLALTLAVTTAGFGAATLRSVTDSRAALARLTVGGDASVVAPPGAALSPAVTRALDALPGLSLGTAFWEDDDVDLTAGPGAGTDTAAGSGTGETAILPYATVVAVDPQAYARVARAIGRGGFDPARLTARPGGAAEQVPALISPDLAAALPGHTFGMNLLSGHELQATVVGQVTGTPALPDLGTAVVVIPAGPTTALQPQTARPNRWLGLGSISPARLRALVPASYGTDTSAAHIAVLADDPLQAAADRMFWICTVATWCFAILAVLLSLVRAGPERASLLARLRTMGLRPRQGARLILAESLPQAFVAALGGGLAAATAVLLLGPTVDLSPLVGSKVPTGLSLTAAPILEQTLVVAGLAAVAVLAEAAVQGRRQITIELRAGDGR